MYFYELHEGDDDLYSDVLLALDEEIAPEDFFDLVQTIRRRVAADFGEDTLIEAIAVELERSHGFVYVSDERLTAAVSVSADEDGNFDWAAPDEEVHAFVNDLERTVGTYLYGRRMYEVMVAWETMPLAD